MKIIEILKKLDRSNSNKREININDFALNEFGIDVGIGYLEDDAPLEAFFISNKYSTDTVVGYIGYFLGGYPMAISIQDSNRSDENVYWLNKDTYNNVKKYIIDLFLNNTDKAVSFLDDGVNEEFPDFYQLDYCNEIMGNHYYKSFYKGKKVEITNTNPLKKPNEYDINHTVEILYRGKNIMVDLSEIYFEFNILK